MCKILFNLHYNDELFASIIFVVIYLKKKTISQSFVVYL